MRHFMSFDILSLDLLLFIVYISMQLMRQSNYYQCLVINLKQYSCIPAITQFDHNSKISSIAIIQASSTEDIAKVKILFLEEK